ncbi:hypothetical protein BDR07DRAFT_1371651 [Suillus spraguei]|nr:hypothetical protein BDR07DRAFT_1371651 [Suillus spraguei]
MSSDTPSTDPWLERSRLDGMMLGAVSYGGLLVLTIQAVAALMQRPRHEGKIANYRLVLLAYVFGTFVLGTIGFAANTKYTEMIWIDLRDAPGGPVVLIEDGMDYPINVVAITCYFIMEWIMQALLSGAGVMWYNINAQLAYLCIEVVLSTIYTVLVTNRLLVMRGLMRQVTQEHEYSSIYVTSILMVIESAVLYSVCAIIFIVSFALHSYVTDLCFPSISHVQGIAQLLIIIRVARGRAITWEPSTPVPVVSTYIAFSGTTLDAPEGTNIEQVVRSEQNGVQLHSIGMEVCVA